MHLLVAADGQSLSSSLLLGKSDLLLVSVLGDLLALLSDEQLDVAVAGQVRGDSAVSSESTSATLLGSVDLDVSQVALIRVEAIGHGVPVNIRQQSLHYFDALLRPSSLGGLELFGLGSVTDLGELSEGNTSLVSKDVVQVLPGNLKIPSSDGSSHFIGVLEAGSSVVQARFGGYSGSDRATEMGKMEYHTYTSTSQWVLLSIFPSFTINNNKYRCSLSDLDNFHVGVLPGSTPKG